MYPPLPSPGHQGSVSYGHAASTPSSEKKTSNKKKDRKSSKSSKKKQNDTLLGVGSQFDGDNNGSAGTGNPYPQDIAVD
ncbi:hypothetical protein PG996_003182 [Apiospora saccharicola]|uniref:Uncharacterized protein n=1 Tax=Apiospora saccharicola TaxID=335842 RepID=A0ABR1W0J3_9PEZI